MEKTTSDIGDCEDPLKAKQNFMGLNRGTILSVLGLSGFLILWHVLVTTGIVSERLLAPPVVVLKTFFLKFTQTVPDGNTLQENFYSSITLALIGFISAIAIGTPLGLLMGWYKTIDGLVKPIFELVRPIPPIAWIPLAILWLGVGMVAKSFIIFVAAFVPCVINSYTGVKMTSPVLINVAKTCGASSWQIFSGVCVPSALPMVFTGFRISLGAAWTTLVAAELLAATSGLGYMIQMGRTMIRPDIIIVGMLTIGFTGALMAYTLSLVEGRMAPWRNKK